MSAIGYFSVTNASVLQEKQLNVGTDTMEDSGALRSKSMKLYCLVGIAYRVICSSGHFRNVLERFCAQVFLYRGNFVHKWHCGGDI